VRVAAWPLQILAEPVIVTTRLFDTVTTETAVLVAAHPTELVAVME
jgi:hypothetical protein